MQVGDRVKVIEQDITGTVVEVWGSKVVITDDDSEFEDDYLEFRASDVELI